MGTHRQGRRGKKGDGVLTFAEKFDLLMHLTGTSNSALAKYMALDPSYISRLRRGGRSLPRGADYPAQFAAFFMRQCTADHQRTTLCRALGLPATAAFDDPEEMTQAILSWLCNEDVTVQPDPVAGLLTDMSQMSGHAPRKKTPQREGSDVLVFYGDEGRRQATIALFNQVLQQQGPVSLLLYSDESPAWMTESSAFYYEWSSLLWQIILRGNRVRVIHKISRDIDEMLEVVRQWLPFYASGGVEPFYYPRLRDGVYKRTLSVAPGVAAVFSTSISGQTSAASTFMTMNRQTVDSFTNEFSSYVGMCRPLIRIYTLDEPLSDSVLQHFTTQERDSLLKADGLSLSTMPDEVLRLIADRASPPLTDTFMRLHDGWSHRLEISLSHCKVCQTLRLADPADVLAGREEISCVSFSDASPMYYTPHEYCLHLRNILRLLKRYPNFSVLLDDGPRLGYTLHAFEDGEVHIFKGASPTVVFEIAESNMVSAFWDYMARLRLARASNMTRGEIIAQLEAVVAALQ